mmetsp:Transcript_101992/g.297470  ORF Transcript_101992/g.297470 Transcript_101992/m.297470 type:complete len:204 (+) Transcript_101992:1264-1875(+)
MSLLCLSMYVRFWSKLVMMEMTSLTMMLWTIAPTTIMKPATMISASVPALMSPKPTVVKTVSTKYMDTSHCSRGLCSRSEVPLASTERRPTQVSRGSSCRAAQRYQKHARRCRQARSRVMTLRTLKPLMLLKSLISLLSPTNWKKRERRSNFGSRAIRFSLARRASLFTLGCPRESEEKALSRASTRPAGRQASRLTQKRPRR